MRIALPVDNGMIAGHFGHASNFAIIDVEQGKITGSRIMNPPPHQPGVLPRWLKEQQATHVVCAGIGARAVELLRDAHIEVIAGVPDMDPAKAVEKFLSDRLEGKNAPTCSGHGDERHSCHG